MTSRAPVLIDHMRNGRLILPVGEPWANLTPELENLYLFITTAPPDVFSLTEEQWNVEVTTSNEEFNERVPEPACYALDAAAQIMALELVAEHEQLHQAEEVAPRAQEEEVAEAPAGAPAEDPEVAPEQPQN